VGFKIHRFFSINWELIETLGFAGLEVGAADILEVLDVLATTLADGHVAEVAVSAHKVEGVVGVCGTNTLSRRLSDVVLHLDRVADGCAVLDFRVVGGQRHAAAARAEVCLALVRFSRKRLALPPA